MTVYQNVVTKNHNVYVMVALDVIKATNTSLKKKPLQINEQSVIWMVGLYEHWK